ncbi:MAG: DeoR/GlpR family DNA-binding transcription regulator [Suipraeoptans sp.]
MRTEERRHDILDMIIKNSPVQVSELIERIGDSPATIRRDLTFLEKNGYIVRTRGYAKYVTPEVVHKISFSEGKIAIAKKAAEMVMDGSTIMLDSGSQILALAYQLIGKKDLTAVTNSLSIANVFSMAEVTTHVTGGVLIGREEALVGPEAENYIRKIKAPLLFISTTGVRGTQGLACVTPFQANIKKAFIESAQKVVALIEEEKMDMDALRVFADFKDIHMIITSAPLKDKALENRLSELGVEVIVA